MKNVEKTTSLIMAILCGILFIGATFATIYSTHNQPINQYTKEDFTYGVLAMILAGVTTTLSIIKYERISNS